MATSTYVATASRAALASTTFVSPTVLSPTTPTVPSFTSVVHRRHPHPLSLPHRLRTVRKTTAPTTVVRATATRPTNSASTSSIDHDSSKSSPSPPPPPAPSSVSDRNNTAKESPLPKDAVPYFAYFSNLNPNTFGPDARSPIRRFPVLRTRTAILPSYDLVFDVPGFSPLEPAFANIIPSSSSSSTTSSANRNEPPAVHGVVHWLSPADFGRLSVSEAVVDVKTISSSLSPSSPLNTLLSSLPTPPVPPLPGITRVITVDVETVDPSTGETEVIQARTFEFPHVLPKWAGIRPSKRYITLGLSGADHWGVDRTALETVLERTFGMTKRSIQGHPLDRPNPKEKFGSPALEIFSPYAHIKATHAMDRLEKIRPDDLSKVDLRLVQLSAGEQGKRQGLYFLPGIDGQGKSMLGQISDIDIEGEFFVKSVVYPRGNRQSLEEMAASIIQLIHDDADGRRVSIVGESMGGLLSVMTVLENITRKQTSQSLPTVDIDLHLMINPATSYRRSGPRELWDFLIGLGLSEEMYRALLPPVLLPFLVDLGSVTTGVSPEIIPRLVNVIRSVGSLSDSLPKDAMQHRINLLANHHISEAKLKLLSEEPYGPRFVALVASSNDNLLPSFAESKRLARKIPGLYRAIIPFGGHGPFLDPRVSLASFLRPFLPSKMGDGSGALPSSVETRPASSLSSSSSEDVDKKLLRRRAALRKRYEMRRKTNKDENGEGGDDKEKDNIIRKRMVFSPENTIQKGKSMTSADMDEICEYAKSAFDRFDPVFIGEENVPAYTPGRPLLFVGNHTLLGWLDGMFPMVRFLTTRRTLMRIFGHPILFQGDQLGFPMIGVEALPTDKLVEYGLTPVTPSHVLSSLARGEWGIMFPGGAKEALKSRSDAKYAVKWPDDPEFIRACALFGAAVVPMSIVGTEDLADIIADPQETRAAVEAVGRAVTGNKEFEMTDVTKDFDVRMWKRGPDGKSDTPLIPPLLAPSAKSGPREERVYIRFGKPIEVNQECVEDKALTNSTYKQVRNAVEEGVALLLQRKRKDLHIARWKRDQFKREFGKDASPPCAPGWTWMRGENAYLDDDLQPPL